MVSNVGNGYRFGSFEVQARSQFLLKKGNRIRIERLPLQILLALLETPGKIISREELCSRLWTDQTFQQADKGLQVAVAKLRDALGEQAADPRFIKTVHRVGYQFMGEVIPLVQPGFASDGPLLSRSAGAVSATPLPQNPERVLPWGKSEESKAAPRLVSARFRRAGLHRSFFFAVAGLVVFLLATGFFLHLSHRPLAFVGEQVALGDVTNLTSDPGLDGTLSVAMRINFQQSPYFGMVPDHSFLQQLKQTGGSNTLQARLEACTNLHAQLLMDGEIKATSADPQLPAYDIVLNVWRCGDRRKLATETASATSKASVLPALDLVIDRLRKRMGESDASIERFNAPAAQITTTSLAALRAFNLGEEKRNQGMQIEAVSDFRLAIDLDPQFALAYARLSTVYYNVHERSLSQRYARQAFDLREHASERERLYIASHYYSFVTGEIPQAIQAYELWMTLYPHDPAPPTDLAGEYLSIGEPEKALGPARRAAEDEESANGAAHSALMLSLLETGQYSNLNAFCQDPAQFKSRSAVFHYTCLRLAGVENDEPRIQQEIDWAKVNPGSLGVIEFAALIAERKGELSQGDKLFSQGREIAHNDHLSSFEAELDLDQADVEASVGLQRQARGHALDALKLAPDEPYLQGAAAFALARSGDTAQAQAEADKAAAEAPLDTVLNGVVLPSVYAANQIDRHNPKAAIALLEKTRPLDGNMFMELAPAYNRGLALMADRQLDAATREFRWVIDHRALCPESTYVNLAMLQLSKIQQSSGRCDDAKKQYAKLDISWRDADPLFLPLTELRLSEKNCAAPKVD